MGHKEMEGSNEQRRRKARDAREAGKRASEVGGTLGASKQRKHQPDDAEQHAKLETIREGKQESALKGKAALGPRGKRKVNSEHPATRHRHL